MPPWALAQGGQTETPMAYRSKMKKSKSKKLFRRTASKTNRKNIAPRPMRGGIRL